MRILGIDPGLTRCGVGIVEVDRSRKAVLAGVAVIRTPPERDLALRLLDIARGLAELIDEYAPDAMALERVFAQHNVRTVMGTAQVSGVALLAAAERGIEVGMHTPSEVKAAITGYGSADKQQVGRMVAKVLGLAAAPKPADASDALALAICHGWSRAALASTGPAAPGETPAQLAWREAEKSAAKRRLAP